ncbi:MAG: helix-turn-helix domain-containing protein [Clostridia bacterium]|nr:helix-turn-helix domain-containing protein [Clostridia bacterium]
MNNCIYKKKLCMTELNIGRMHFDRPQYFDAGMGQKNSTFVYVVKGSVTISSLSKSIHVGEGELLFIPEGIRYSAVWRGAPEIEYYSLRIISKKVDISDSASSFALQLVDIHGIDKVGERIGEIHALFSTEERVNMIRALGIYYSLYADILPILKYADTPKYSSAVVTATKYIDTHHAEDFAIDKLAAVCHVSESRLYHLFRDELGTTPIKYRNALRIERAAADLRIAGLTIDEVAGKNGFNSAAYFRETFKSETGLTPTEYRRMAGQSEGER